MHHTGDIKIGGVCHLLALLKNKLRVKCGLVMEEKDAFGCQITHKIMRPDMCIVCDEVGGNTFMKGDGHGGGKKFMCEIAGIPQMKT